LQKDRQLGSVELVILYLLVAAIVVLPIIAWFIVGAQRPKWLWRSLYSLVLGILLYIFIVSYASYTKNRDWAAVRSFDAAHGAVEGFANSLAGEFRPKPGNKDITDEQRQERNKLLHQAVNQTGRSLAPMTGIFFSLIYSFSVWVLIVVITSVTNLIHRSK